MNFVNLPPEWNNTGTEPSQTLKDNGFAPGYKPPAAVFNWYWSKVGACLSEIQNNVLGKKFVASLPSSSRYYDFGTVTAFTAVERCTLDIISESAEKFLRVTTADNAGNKYALAQLNFADIGQTADSFVIEMDTRMPSSRWYISFVDLSKRPGTSNKISYDLTGVAFSCGTTDGAEYNVNGVSVLGNTFADAWLSMKVTINVKAKSIKYEIKERDSNTVLATETVSFRDSGVDKITGIELYSYTQTTIDIDNIKITAGHDIEENILYCVGTDDVYDTYIYIDSEPVLISSQTDVKSLKEIGHTHNNKDVLDDISSSDISNWNGKANVDTLSGADVLTLESGIYQIENNCTHLPSDIGNPETGITLIVTPNSSFFGNNNWKNIFVIANYYNDIKYSKIWACQVIGNSDYDMPWTLIHDSSARFYSNNPQKIGTWIDGTPVWRVAFEGHPSSLDYSDKSYSVKDLLSLKNQDNAFVINQNGYGGDADNPNMLDCHPLDNDSAGTFAINDSIKLVFGYIDFVTPANNIS